ncbi:MerR family transcriptional regulator [Spirochaetia bacterium]|nr:MerR family transcriptional regulator [Spirochaetia bacterium]GHU95542.1 MerR family transcriptional regulator [Spirochaetia bacterium]
MAFYGIRDVERLLKVKVHVLRYWEQEISLIQPKKDVTGKLRYSNRDLQIFLRLKYLLYKRHFTVEGAREELFREAAGDQQDLRAQIAALRSELVDLCFLINNKDVPRDAP